MSETQIAEVKAKRLPRWARIILWVLLVLLIILIGLRLFAKTSWAANLVEARIGAVRPAGQSIAIDGLKGDLLGEFELETLTVMDANGAWLNIENVAMDWSPLSLLFGDLKIASLSADKVDVMNRPVLVSEEKDSEGGFAIDSYVLDVFDFPLVTVSGAIAPQDVALRASGGFSHGSDGGKLNLNSQTLEAAPKDIADIDISWSPEFLLSGRADITSEPDGLLSSLSKLGAGQALSFSINTQGTLNELTTNLLGKIGSRDVISGRIFKENNSAKITANIAASEIPLLARFDNMLGGDVDVVATLDELSKDAIVNAQIRAPKLALDFDARQIKDGYRFDRLEADITSPLSMLDAPPAEIGRLRFSGAAELTETVSLKGQITASDLAYTDTKIKTISGPIDVSVTGDVIDVNVKLTGQAEKSGAFVNAEETSITAEFIGIYNTERQAVTISRSDIRLPGLSVQAKGSADISSRDVNMSGQYDLSKNGLIATLPANISGTFTALSRNQIRITGTALDIEGLPDPVSQLVTEKVDFETDILIGEDNQVTFNNASVTAEKLRVQGSGNYNGEAGLKAALDFETDDFTMSGAQISNLAGDLTLDGTPDNLRFDLTSRTQDVTSGERQFSDLTLDTDGTYVNGRVEANVAIDAQSEQGELSATTTAQYENGQWRLNELDGALGDLSVAGEASGQGGDISALTADMKIAGDPSAFIPAENIDAHVQLSGARANVKGDLGGITAGPLRGAKLGFTAQGPREAIAFEAALDGPSVIADITRPVAVKAAGRASLMPDDISLTSQLSGNLGENNFETTSPLQIKRDEAGLTGRGALSMLGGETSFDLDSAQNRLTVQGDALTLASIQSLLGRPVLDGKVNFSGEFTTMGSVPDGTFTAALLGVKQPGSDVPPLDVNVDGALRAGELSATAKSTNETLAGQATLGGRIEASVKPPFVTWPPAAPLRGEAVAAGDIGALAELVLPPETEVKGEVDLDLKYSLPLDTKGLVGTLSMNSGIFEQGNIGLRLTDMGFNSTLSGTTITVTDFNAKGPKGGTLSGGGQTDIGPSNSSAVTLTAKNLQVFSRREGSAVMSGDLKFTHADDTLTLSGILIAEDANLAIDKFSSAGRPTLDVNFDDPQEEAEEKVAPVQTSIDLTLTSPGRISLRGRGVNAYMALDAKITGSFTDPVLTGQASIARGRFDFIGKRFEFVDSKVTFANPVTQSKLNVSAMRETSDVTATVRITGTVDRPQIDLLAEPDLPEDEVLSRILFGRSASQLTTIETARLAAALAQLSGGGGFDLFGNLENALGLDTLDIGQNAGGQTQLTTGKYLAEDVYVELRTSAEGTPGVAVEWTPRKNIEIEAETEPGQSQSLSIQWKKDFD